MKDLDPYLDSRYNLSVGVLGKDAHPLRE